MACLIPLGLKTWMSSMDPKRQVVICSWSTFHSFFIIPACLIQPPLNPAASAHWHIAACALGFLWTHSWQNETKLCVLSSISCSNCKWVSRCLECMLLDLVSYQELGDMGTDLIFFFKKLTQLFLHYFMCSSLFFIQHPGLTAALQQMHHHQAHSVLHDLQYV